MRHLAVLLFSFITIAIPAQAENLTVIAWNVESGGAESDRIAEVIGGIEADIWGFSELASYEWLEEFEIAAENKMGEPFGKIIGSTGEYTDSNRDPDYLAFLYNETKLEKLDVRQLHTINDWEHRSPLAASFRLRSSGETFVVVLNHLASGDQQLRMQQAWQLREWAFFRESPLILIGDFNFRWKIGESEADPPRDYAALTHGGVLHWLQPDPPAHTWCGGARDGIFDYIFVNDAASQWQGESDVIATRCDKSDHTVSDHRPVRAVFEIS